jgi:hypothetical protein
MMNPAEPVMHTFIFFNTFASVRIYSRRPDNQTFSRIVRPASATINRA